MQILIIDSSVPIMERMEEIILETRNVTAIHRAVCYKEAKKLFEKNKYDIVVLDINLPGNESLRFLKEKKANDKTSVIIMFTHIDNYTLEQCKSLGVDFFFDKYYDFERIYRLMEIHYLLTKNDLFKNQNR